MKITINNQQQDVILKIPAIRAKMRKFLNMLDLGKWCVSMSFVDEETIANYNQTYRNKSGSTDILSFAALPELRPGQPILPSDDGLYDLGDLIFCPTKILQAAEEWHVTFEVRLERLMAHGLAHLLGYDHESDADYALMKALEEKLLGYELNE